MNNEELKVIKDYYYKNGCKYDFHLKYIVEKYIKQDENNLSLLVKQRFARKMFEKLNPNIVKRYVNLVLKSGDANDIYDCAYALGKRYSEQLDLLVKAMLTTNDLSNIFGMAVNVKNINKDQFMSLAKKVADSKDVKSILIMSSYVKSHKSGEGFFMLREFVEYIMNFNDDYLVDKLITDVDNKMQDHTPSYAKPFGEALTNEQISFRAELSTARWVKSINQEKD